MARRIRQPPAAPDVTTTEPEMAWAVRWLRRWAMRPVMMMAPDVVLAAWAPIASEVDRLAARPAPAGDRVTAIHQFLGAAAPPTGWTGGPLVESAMAFLAQLRAASLARSSR